VKQRIGEKACPFNYLYWNFLQKNQKKLGGNMRLQFAYKALNKFSLSERQAIQKQAAHFLASLA
jgi:deoxyribodipyrimidine photolyase-related protein